MTITEKQLIERRKGVGSSDAAAIMGHDPFKSAHDVWREKMGIEPPFEGNDATDFGNMAEDMLRKYASKYVGMPVAAPKGAFVKGVLRANVDGQVGAYGRGSPIVECKTSRIPDGWGEPGTDEVPNKVNIQVHHQMLCADADFSYVVRLSPFMKVDVYEVPFNGDIGRSVLEQCTQWWERHVVNRHEPDVTPATETTLAYFKSLKRDNQIEAFINDDLINYYELAKAEEKAVEQKVRNARAKLEQAMGNAATGIGNGRAAVITCVAGRTKFDHKKLKIAHPEIYEQFVSVGNPYTQLRIKKDKA